jgi:hypothetical protein
MACRPSRFRSNGAATKAPEAASPGHLDGCSYSNRIASTGFANAARSDWLATVASATTRTRPPVSANTPIPRSVRKANCSSQSAMNRYAGGENKTTETATKSPISRVSRYTTCGAEAPRTLLTPISRRLRWTVNVARPERPRHATRIARAAIEPKTRPNVCSDAYCWVTDSSRNC